MNKVEIGSLSIGDKFKYKDDSDEAVFTVDRHNDGRVYMNDGTGEHWNHYSLEVFIEKEEEFKKFDIGKPRVELIEPQFTLGVAKILTFGAEKYGAFNWQKMEEDDLLRIKGAMQRHMLAYQDGTEVDEESGLSHLYHIATNAMFLDYFNRKKREKVVMYYDEKESVYIPWHDIKF